MKYLNIPVSQSLVSLRRIEKYLHGTEVTSVPPLSCQNQTIALQSATVTWPQDRSHLGSKTPSAASTPRKKFVLVDLTLSFPIGELSLICGKLGSGKTLLLLGMRSLMCIVILSWWGWTFYLALLGEVDLLSGQVLCPRSPLDALAGFVGVHVAKEEWIVEGICAYVPQVIITFLSLSLSSIRTTGYLAQKCFHKRWTSMSSIPQHLFIFLQRTFFLVCLLTQNGIKRRWRCVIPCIHTWVCSHILL